MKQPEQVADTVQLFLIKNESGEYVYVAPQYITESAYALLSFIRKLIQHQH